MAAVARCVKFGSCQTWHGRNGLVTCVPAWRCKVRRGLVRKGQDWQGSYGIVRFVALCFGEVCSGRAAVDRFVLLRWGLVCSGGERLAVVRQLWHGVFCSGYVWLAAQGFGLAGQLRRGVLGFVLVR